MAGLPSPFRVARNVSLPYDHSSASNNNAEYRYRLVSKMECELQCRSEKEDQNQGTAHVVMTSSTTKHPPAYNKECSNTYGTTVNTTLRKSSTENCAKDF